jgi:hypothetical protein
LHAFIYLFLFFFFLLFIRKWKRPKRAPIEQKATQRRNHPVSKQMQTSKQTNKQPPLILHASIDEQMRTKNPSHRKVTISITIVNIINPSFFLSFFCLPITQHTSHRSFDMSRYQQLQVALRFSYVGWTYHGFASQQDNPNTIENHILSALEKTCLIESRDNCNYSRGARTDKGVSACGSVIACRVRGPKIQKESNDS